LFLQQSIAELQLRGRKNKSNDDNEKILIVGEAVSKVVMVLQAIWWKIGSYQDAGLLETPKSIICYVLG